MQEQENKRHAEIKEQKMIAFLIIGPIVLTYAIAPWVWPIGLGAGLIAVKVIRLAGKGSLGAAACVALTSGLIGCVFTLPASSLHSFWVREHWANPQNLPVLSLYSVALFVWGAALVFLWSRQRGPAKRQLG